MPLEKELKEAEYSYHLIGDAGQAGKALDAIWEGAAIGRDYKERLK